MKQLLLAAALLASSAVLGDVRAHRPGSNLIIVRPGGSDFGLRQQAIRAAQQARHELQQLAYEVYDYRGGSFGIDVRGGGRRPGGFGDISELAQDLADALQDDVIEELRHGERLGKVARNVDYLMDDLSDLARAIRRSSESDELSFRFGRVVQFFRQLQSIL